MRLLIVTGIFPPDIGGPASYVPEMARSLSEGLEILAVITLSNVDVFDSDKLYKFPIIRVLRDGNNFIRRVRTIYLIAKYASRADLVYLNGLYFEGVIACKILVRRKLVMKIVGDWAWEYARNKRLTDLELDEFLKFPNKSFFLKILTALRSALLLAATSIIVPSNYLKEILLSLGVEETKIKVIYNAVQINSEDCGSAHVSQLKKYDVVTVGRLVTWKGIDDLIVVCSKLNKSLLIVGDGPERKSLENKAISLSASAEFVGQVEKNQINSLIKQARVFVLNSTYEGLPHILLEAKSAKVPIIATSVGGNVECITHGVDGMLVDASDNQSLGLALSYLLDDEVKRNEFAECGYADLIDRFRYSKMLEQTLNVLKYSAK